MYKLVDKNLPGYSMLAHQDVRAYGRSVEKF